jgi:hypothetical protein
MNLGKGVEINNKKLSILQPVFNQWINNVTKYCSTPLGNEPDAPYWYNERTTLSTLAGAVWAAGGVALEEYRATKGYGRDEWEGRIDLWFRFNRQMFVAETKQLWFRINKIVFENLFIDKLLNRLKEAKRDAREVPKSEGHRMGIVFIVPSISLEYKESRNRIILKCIEKIRKIDQCICAWSFPGVVRTLTWDDENAIYPGVMIVGKCI